MIMESNVGRRGFIMGCLSACVMMMGCPGDEGSLQTIEVTVTLSPTSPMERDVLVEFFERDPSDATEPATVIDAQKITQITTRGSRSFTARVQDDKEYYFTARPDPALRCAGDYQFDGEPSFFRGANAPSKVDLKLSAPDLLTQCQ
jgi:hypothetical protein